MTKEQYLQLVREHQEICDKAFWTKQIIPIPWQTLIYETLEEDKEEHEQFYKFNRNQRMYWANIEKIQGVVNTYRDKNIMVVNYLVWYGKIYLPSFQCDLSRLPQLDSRSMHEALSHGYLTQIAEPLQFYAANIIENEEAKFRYGIRGLEQYDFRNHIGKTLWKNKV